MNLAEKLHRRHKFGNTESMQAWEWHQDCLVVNILLASCFDQKSMKKMLKRAGFIEGARHGRQELTMYAMHEACHVDKNIQAAVTMDLNKKFNSTMHAVNNLSIDEIVQKANQAPWLIPLIWACYAHDSIDVRRAGREIAHLAIWKGMKRLRGDSQVAREKERADKLLKQNVDLRQTLSEKQKQIKKLSEQLKRMQEQRVIQSMPAPPSIAPIKNEVKRLRRELSEQTRLSQNLQRDVSVWRSLALNAEQHKHSKSAKKPPHEYEKRAESLIDCDHNCDDCVCAQSSGCPLDGKTVAVIGGLKRLEKGYCQVIKDMGGQGISHTGNVRSGTRRLRQLVNRSDVVVYITPLNSHGSLDVVKKQCKRCNTPFCPLNSTSPATLESHLKNMAIFF
jgi:hypothetical protein